MLWYLFVCPAHSCLEAPGEAEAELAALNQCGLIDIVLTTDGDAVVFGATCIARWCVLRVPCLLVIDSERNFFFPCPRQPCGPWSFRSSRDLY